MQEKIAELNEITSFDDAERKVEDWLTAKYPDQLAVLETCSVVKAADGWYVQYDVQPRLAGPDG